MTQQENLALELIEKEKREKTGFLDLGNCGLAEVPNAVRELVWLKSLVFESFYGKYSNNDVEFVESHNKGEANTITRLPDWIAELTDLQELFLTATMTDLSPLSGLVDLKYLSCSLAPVTDLSPLAKLVGLQTLDCTDTMVADLSPLAGLTKLQILICGFTQVDDLSPLANLSGLQMLDCGKSQVADLSPLSGLIELQTLGLSRTKVSDLSALTGLTKLQSLGIFDTNVEDLSPLSSISGMQTLICSSIPVTDWSPLSFLTGLKRLNCSETSVADLSPLIGLEDLQELYCYKTRAVDLTPLANLAHLQELDCSRTLVADLTPLTALVDMQKLNCSETLVTDLSPLVNLTLLQELDCSHTLVTDLTPLTGLAGLQKFHCSGTPVSDLSPFWPKIKAGWPVRWENYADPGINVENCPLIIPPVEFAIEGPEAVVEYFEQLGDDGRPLNEVKVIFLGEGEAGKTSLIKRLRDEGFNPKESQTHGIRIQKTPFEFDGGTVIAHCWDFGGQEVNHATHQFFLSQRCIYVVVLNSRSDDKAEKWLKHAASFGGRSPVLVVLNKIDENPAFEVDRKRLREKYPNIQDFFRLSCANKQGVAEFHQALARQIEQADTRRTPFPATWLTVKDHFAHMAQDYIDSAQYRAVCEANGVARRFSQDVLLQFLHDLGLVINFRNLKNFDTQILNPLWLTNGVYRIINSAKVADAQGLLHEADFDAVINDRRYDKAGEPVLRYPLDKLNYIVRVMQEFELCYQWDERRYVVPQLLPVSEPDFTIQGKGLRFTIRFPELLPDSIFPRLMVKLHGFIEGELRWRTGMVLHKPSVFDASARVREDKEDREIQIEVCGQEPRRLLSFIRETVKEIVDGFANLPITEWVPIPGHKDFLEYKSLVAAENRGKKEIFVWQIEQDIPVADLLDGVEEAAMRDELAQTPVKAFVSYSHQDLEYLDKLRAALSPLVRLDKLSLWDDRAIDAGEDWNKVIFQQLAEADLVLCLVSADFIASDFCYTKELATALAAHHQAEKTVVPIRLRECDWDDLPLAKLQGQPSQWIASAADKDAAWTAVSKSLGPAIQQAKQRKARRYPDHARRPDSA